MRKRDKKLNIQRVNLIAEQAYLRSKGLISENLGYGFQDEGSMCESPLGECGMGGQGMYEEPMQPEMEMETHEEPLRDLKGTLRNLEPKGIQGKIDFLQELESFVQELRYVIGRESEGQGQMGM